MLALFAGSATLAPSALRAEHEDGLPHTGGSGGPGGSGGHDDGAHDDGGPDDGGHDDGGHDDGGHDGGKGGKGGHGGGGDTPSPQPVDKERDSLANSAADLDMATAAPALLKLLRVPEHVRRAAYAEALASFTAEKRTVYDLPIDAVVRLVATPGGADRFLSTPLQNLALLEDALDGRSVLADVGVRNDWVTLSAIFLGLAAGDDQPVTGPVVFVVAAVLGQLPGGAEMTQIARDAERIRVARVAAAR